MTEFTVRAATGASAARRVVGADVFGGGTDDVLVRCVLAERDPALGERLARMTEDEWLTLAARAQRHHVLPLLRDTLNALPAAPAPPSRVARALENAHAYAQRESRRRFDNLATVVTALRAARVPVAVLKGGYLAPVVYAERTLRTMADLDVLVPRDDLPAADEALTGLGYDRERSDYAVLLCGAHLPEFKKAGASRVEVHWSLNAFGLPREEVPGRPVFAIDMDEVWSRVRPLHIDGLELYALAPDDMLLHLCLHTGYNHAFLGGVRGFCDIDRLVRREGAELDWARLVATAREWGAARLVQATLRIAYEALGTAIPPGALRQVAWTEQDEAAYPLIRTEVLRYPRPSAERARRRAIVDPWILDATGAPSRSDLSYD